MRHTESTSKRIFCRCNTMYVEGNDLWHRNNFFFSFPRISFIGGLASMGRRVLHAGKGPYLAFKSKGSFYWSFSCAGSKDSFFHAIHPSGIYYVDLSSLWQLHLYIFFLHRRWWLRRSRYYSGRKWRRKKQRSIITLTGAIICAGWKSVRIVPSILQPLRDFNLRWLLYFVYETFKIIQ